MEILCNLFDNASGVISIISATISVIFFFATKKEKERAEQLVNKFHEEGGNLFAKQNELIDNKRQFEQAKNKLWEFLKESPTGEMGIEELKSHFGNEIDDFDIYELLEALESERKIKQILPATSPRFWYFRIRA